MQKAARFDITGKYRHWLSRTWDEHLPVMTYVMLNPSTADSDKDDQTIRRCIYYAQREGYGQLRVVNLFDFKATNPKDLFVEPLPYSAMNLPTILEQTMSSELVVCAWGANANRAFIKEQALVVSAMLRDMKPLWCLGVTKDGHPNHPLMLRNDQLLIEWPGYALS